MQQLALAQVFGLAVLGGHDKGRRHAFERPDLQQRLCRHDEVGVVAAQRGVAVPLVGRPLGAGAEPPDELTGHVLERGEGTAAAVVLRHPERQTSQPVQRRLQLLSRCLGPVPRSRQADDALAVLLRAQPAELQPPRHDGVLDVVHGVRHVVGEVHDLCLQARPGVRRSAAQPVKRRCVVLVRAELGRDLRRVSAPPWVLRRGVQARPRQVEPGAAAVWVHRLGLEPGEQPQRLGVALEPADAGGGLVQGPLAVVPERRVPEVVSEAGGVHDVLVAAHGRGELAPDLRHLEGVREPVAYEVVAARADDLRLGSESTQRGAVHDPGPVTDKGRTARALGRLGRPAFLVGLVVEHRAQRVTERVRRLSTSHVPARKATVNAVRMSQYVVTS